MQEGYSNFQVIELRLSRREAHERENESAKHNTSYSTRRESHERAQREEDAQQDTILSRGLNTAPTNPLSFPYVPSHVVMQLP